MALELELRLIEKLGVVLIFNFLLVNLHIRQKIAEKR